MRTSIKRKLSLISTIGLSLFSVISASVSTFAWFQVNASAVISTSSASTTITVNKPDDYTFYGYEGNIGEHTPSGTFSNDFASLTTTSLVNTYTKFDDMVPGEIKIFAIGINAASSVSLTLNEFVSNNAVKQNILDGALTPAIQHRYVYNTANYELNIGYAIDIFVSAYTPANGNAPTGYTSFLSSTSGTDKFDYSINTTSHRTLLDSGSYANPSINQDISFYSNDSLTSTNDLYIFWSVVYSDDNSLHYNEVTSSGGSLKEAPETGNRYFAQNNTGTSNCFGGLDFALKTFTLTIG